MADAQVGILRVLLTANTAEFTSGMKQAAVGTKAFEQELAKAKERMAPLQVSARGVTEQFARLSNAFAGTKLLRDAEVTAAAIEKIGGAGKLTEAELRKVAARFDQVTEKARLMGQALPSSVTAMNDAVRTQIAQLDTAAKKTVAWGGALTNIKSIAAGLVAGFGLQSLISGLGRAVTSTIEWGGAISDLSAKTGVSTTALQRWEFAAKQSGNTLDQIVTASLQLSKRIEEGDKAVEAAITGLGLSLAQLRGQKPEEQFNAVAEALARTTDQGERASAAMALFGRSGADLLPTLTADMRKLGDQAERLGAVLDEQTIQAMDELGDSWQALKDTGRGLLAQVLSPMVATLNDLADAAGRVSRETNRGGFWQGLLRFGGEWGAIVAGLPQAGALADFNDQRVFPGDTVGPANPWSQANYNLPYNAALEETTTGLRETASSAREAARALRTVADAVLRDVDLWNGSRNGGVSIFQRLPFVSPSLLQSPAVLGGQMNPWGGIAAPVPYGSGSNYSGLLAPGLNWRGAGVAGLNAAMPFLAQAIAGGSRGGQIGGSIGGAGGGIFDALTKGAGGLLGSLSGFLGPIAGIVGSLIGKLFGPSRGAILGREADARIGQSQQGLLAQYGSVDAIRALGPAGSALADAWGSKNVQGEAHFNRLLDIFTKTRDTEAQILDLEQQRAAIAASLVPTWDQVGAAIAKYAIAEGSLGLAVNQLGTTATFKSLLEDIDLFLRAGADVGGMLYGMREEISAVVQESIRLGTEIPANMRPYLEELARSGHLLDENGEALTDLSNLRWGAEVETEAEQSRQAMEKLDETLAGLKATIDKLTAALTGDLPSAAERAAQGVQDAFDGVDIRIPVRYEPEGPNPVSVPYARGGLVAATQYRSIGGAILDVANRGFLPRGTDTVPAMLTPGELVLTAQQQRSLLGALQASTGATSSLASTLAHDAGGLAPAIAGGDQTIVVVDGRGTKDDLVNRIVQALPRKARQNELGFRTLLREALGVTA